MEGDYMIMNFLTQKYRSDGLFSGLIGFEN